MSTELNGALAIAEREFEEKVRRAFDELAKATLPDVAVKRIHSYSMAEDNETLCIMCDMADGSTAMISITPGRPIAASIVA